ncbi:pilus assembly protein [Pseudoduganella sp. OTU4001]|uniref:pilus assembly protein n=1 Tax=Pseudoduganella sp. OTU4001 TaxID=3043854 RepID=UPI00313DE2CE
MKKIFTFVAASAALASALLPGAADAAKTNIAQVPLLNITGTGTVKPNLMLLFDNSGSMESHFTPDNVNDNLCRSKATLAAGQMACAPGHPPFMSSDFNRQYYNPRIRYQPPIKWDGSFYPEQTSANTSAWTSVASDGFNKLNRDLFGTSDTSINLVTGFPDLKWCDPNNTSDCKVNGAYAYPNATYTSATAISGAPYYYTIVVSEYCQDDTLKKCVPVTQGASAPAGYPVPAKVRWCDSTALTNCQAKNAGTFKYPKFSTPVTSTKALATLTVGASGTPTSLGVTSVSITDPATGAVTVISNGTVTASSGTDTAAKRTAMASAIAANIIAKDKTSAPAQAYWACVRTPSGQPTVSACSTYGITLSSDDVVAVLPLICGNGAKDLSNCQFVADDAAVNVRAGWPLSTAVNSANPAPAANWPATAVISLSGNKLGAARTITNVKLGSKSLVSSVSLSKNDQPSAVASKLRTAINNANVAGITAYLGGDAASKVCAPLPATAVCIADTAGAIDVMPSLSTTILGSETVFAFTKSATAPDSIAMTSTAVSSGSGGNQPAFVRTSIISGQTYPKAATRTDCAGANSCTYQEEMTNFANWYSYYKSRMQMMKTAVGHAFSSLNANYRVGYALLSEAAVGGAMKLKPAEFSGTSRSTFYTKLYETTTSGSTPSRPALDNVGRMFSNLSPYEYPAGEEVVQFPCQQNFTLFTTDGYWNGGSTSNVVNNDNKEDAARFCTRAGGCVDTRSQTAPSLADVALHWYNGGSSTETVALRGDALDKDMTKPGKVPAGSGENTHLHMNTFTLGLGMDGLMTYEKNYATAPKVGGDYYNVITGVKTGCPWNGGGEWVWPDPEVTNAGNTVQARVDDLWHAAVNGKGLYFSANEPKEVVDGLAAALGKMQQTIGAASAAATSTPNISLEDNDIFSDTFTTVKWYGELADRKIDTTTGEVGATPVWTTTGVLGKEVGASSDTRSIWKIDEAGTLEDFSYANLSALEKSWFDSKCLSLPQCILLNATERATVDSGANMVNWLRGQQQHADDKIYRAYTMTTFTPTGASGPIPIVLGDIASSKPAYLREPRKSYTSAGYSTYKSENAKRPATVFTAANDGMLHAFDASNGEERFAYVPRITMSKLWNLTSTTYATNHIFTTDGSPELGDVIIEGKWRTVLVAGLNGGGRGFYALDVTEADKGIIKPLWELCASATVCASHNDPDIGLTFGNPQFGMWNNKWVVLLTSGYNNAPGVDGVGTGDGKGYLYIVEVATGNILKKVSTGKGDATTPSGFAKITAITSDPASDPVFTYVYGGDNDGRMWRFDLTSATGAVTVQELADAGASQPITARPDVTLCAVKDEHGEVSTKRVVLFGTGRLLDVPDTSNVDVQSLYLIKDTGAKIDVRGTGMVEQTLTASGGNTQTFTISNKDVNLLTKNGWFFDWKLNPGERMNLDPKIVSGVANVVTNIPSSETSCSVGGTSNYYGLDVCKGFGIDSDVVGGTLSNTSAAVGFIIVRLPKGELKMITTTAKGETITKPVKEMKSAEVHPAGWRRVKGD